MREHDWKREILDGGHLGGYEDWECRRCGATSLGNPDPRTPEMELRHASGQFYACGCGSEATRLPADCDDAQVCITEHRKICPRLRNQTG